ncbi:MAG TPA: carboxymuconolactone decarboxylase family protein [Rubrivivax sp.]|nr:carboxymuconolactone decarboxylase family protein [Rubrivivax sp.]
MNVRKHLPEGNWRIVSPRIPPMKREDCAPDQQKLLSELRRTQKSEKDMNVFMYLTRLGPIFVHYFAFFVNMLFLGKIPRADKELSIMRLAWRTGTVYEWLHHQKVARESGIPAADMNSVTIEDCPDWSPRLRALLKATDELVADKAMSDGTFHELRKHLSEDQMVEFCMLIGHYLMVAMTINTIGIQVEPEYLPSEG